MGPVCIIVMGVSGCGKSTLAEALSKQLDMPYIDADDLHPRANVEKMSKGEPLDDADREPWLEIVRSTAEAVCSEQQDADRARRKIWGVITACSALKKYYRDILRGVHKPEKFQSHIDPSRQFRIPTYFVFMSGPRECLFERLSARKGHYMKADMLTSQLRTLEDPTGEDGVIVVNLEEHTEVQLSLAREKLEAMVQENNL